MRILLAEDEKVLSTVLVTVLKRNNYSVDAVYNGRDALAYLKSDLYDLAILDVMMPYMDGITVLKTIRAEGNRIPVIVLTAKSETDDKITGLDSGADDYVTKPFEMRELIARVRAVARRKDAPREDVLSLGNLTLDKTSYELICGDKSARLGHKEFQLMEMLMERRGAVISAEQFMEKIWDVDSDAEMNVVWVYISGLRKKLLAIGANVAIRANRNIGYSLEVGND